MLRYPRFAAVSAVLLFAISPVAATAADDTDITATARPAAQSSWLAMSGPDSEGLISVSIDVSDLNLALQPEQKVMGKRVRTGVNQLCERIVYDPTGYSGVYDTEGLEQRCRSNTYSSAKPQMASAIAAAERGDRVAMIGMQPRM